MSAPAPVRQRKNESEQSKVPVQPQKRPLSDVEEQSPEFAMSHGGGVRTEAMNRAMLAMTDGLASASWLLGTWTGSGKGAFPNMGGEEFYYSEEATFVPGEFERGIHRNCNQG
jgi:hypothetical protein